MICNVKEGHESEDWQSGITNAHAAGLFQRRRRTTVSDIRSRAMKPTRTPENTHAAMRHGGLCPQAKGC